MDTMNFYSKKQVTLNDIKSLAEDLGYGTSWVTGFFKETRLNIYFGLWESHEWWQWYEMDLDKIWFDTEADRNRVLALQPVTIILFEYAKFHLPQVIVFCQVLLKRYGGWLDCRGKGLTLYTLENLDEILHGCP